MQIIFETPRLYLRRFTDADSSLVFYLNSFQEVVEYVHEPVHTCVEFSRNVLFEHILPQYALYNLGRLAVYVKENDEFIGWCGLKFRPELNEIDLGYRYIPSSWGKGFATEAAKHTLDYGFSKLQLKEIIGRAHVDNKASLSVLKKIGMTYLRNEVVDHCPVETYHSINPNV
ncbi:MAG: GNAT family N-acetyltransferase [Lacibacter sp.]